MLTELKKLKPNPLRNFDVDPIDESRVADLKESIKEDGFWGGVVCRRNGNGGFEIVAGAHRVAAALSAGIREAHVFVAEDLGDASAVRIYARENATQRGNSGTAQAGSVASAIRVIAKAALSGRGGSREFPGTIDFDTVRGNLMSERGIGQNVILRVLEGIPGINENTIIQSLGHLKASGDYGKIIATVQAEIEQENKEALAALERAEKEQAKAEEAARKAEADRKEAIAKAKAAREEADRKKAEHDRQRAEAEAKLAEKRRVEADKAMEKFEALKRTRDDSQKAVNASGNAPTTFDFEGVAKHLNVSHQLDVFRKIVTGPAVSPLLPVNKQAELAKRLVKMAKDENRELSGAFLREQITSQVILVRQAARKLTREEEDSLKRSDKTARFKALQEDFSRNCRGMFTAGFKIAELLDKWPAGLAVPISGEFKEALKNANKTLAALEKRI